MIIVLLIFFALIFAIVMNFRKTLFEGWMLYSLRNEYIVVSLTTTPYRINKIGPVIDFILAESIPIKGVYLNIPHVFKRDNLEYQIPSWLSDNKRITILRSKDYGPGTKLLGTLEQASIPPNAIIITVDDDVTYPKNMLLYLAYKAQQNPAYAIGLSGMNPHYNKMGKIITDSISGIGLKPNRKGNAFVSILEGFAGVAYRRYFFDDSIFALEDAPRECRNSDDLYLSFHLAKKNIPRQVLHTRNMSIDHVVWNTEVGFNQDALHQLSPSPAERHCACVEFMKEQNPGVKF